MKLTTDSVDLLKHGLIATLLVVAWFALTFLSHNVVVQSMVGWLGLGGLILYARWLFKHKVSRSLHRTRSEVVNILESALATGGGDDFDDFVSLKIAEPELESIRQRCLDTIFAPKDVFENTLRQLITQLRAQNRV
jgi:hypothetical protein